MRTSKDIAVEITEAVRKDGCPAHIEAMIVEYDDAKLREDERELEISQKFPKGSKRLVGRMK